MKTTNLVIHGHFYQPPRENANSNLIEIQESARPYPNWNENIYSSCYKPNAYSRYLDASGRVISIRNNYEYMSLNFGPTLLSWLEKNHIRTYSKLLEADYNSKKRLGEGNFIAQVYNHSILPLDSESDARHQISWALNDFKKRFNRDSKGIWLAETALSKTVIDYLADNEVKFVILSPFQAQQYYNDEGKLVKANYVDYSQPYYIEGHKNRIIAFFYHGDLASQISFNHMLRSADNMYQSLLEIKQSDNPLLLHTATDGEIYGHHESFGDMAYAALIEKIKANNDFKITNYAAFLNENKVKRTAILYQGEDNKGSSWSCYHGVGRWERDCGCHTGGPDTWNQKWRSPLRKAMDIVRDFVDFKIKNLNLDFDILSEFNLVLSSYMDMRAYLDYMSNKYTISKKNYPEIARALSAKYYSSSSYASCGWFFNDISGIEPRKNIDFAYKAIKLYDDKVVEKAFLDTLSLAKSNTNELNGKEIALEEYKDFSFEGQAASLFCALKAIDKLDINEYGFCSLKSLKEIEENTYLVEVYNKFLMTTTKMEVSLIGKLDDLCIKIDGQSFSFNKVINSKYYKNILSGHLLDKINFINIKEISKYAQIFKEGDLISSLILKNNESYENLMLLVLRSIFKLKKKVAWQSEYKLIKQIVKSFMIKPTKKGQEELEKILNSMGKELAISIYEDGLTSTKSDMILAFLDLCRSNLIQPDLTHLQDVVFPLRNDSSFLRYINRDKLLSDLNFALEDL